MKRIWEIFPFFNEEMIADIREKELDCYETVVIEATETFSGKPKECFYRGPGLVITVKDFNGLTDAWQREEYQENYALPFLQIQDDDIVICSDVDEVPRWQTILELAEVLGPSLPAVRLSMTHHKYRFNLVDERTPWVKTGVCTGKIFKRRNFTGIRNWAEAPVIPDAGWHLYGIGTDKQFVEKAKATSHFNDQATIQMINRIESGSSLLDEERAGLTYFPTEKLPHGCLDYPQFIES